MGTYINIGKFSCVTHARRFGKSMAAEMLCAYYEQHACQIEKNVKD